MRRFKLPSSHWTWDQVVLILGPVLLSAVLLVLYAAGLLPVEWPGLLIIVLLVNLAGDLAYALKNERGVKQGRVPLCNDIVGSRATVVADFLRDGAAFTGVVAIGGERWRAVSTHALDEGDPVEVVGRRRGLVLDVEKQDR